MEGKLEFSLTPVSGTLKAKGGFRAKLGTRRKDLLGLDDVVHEAKEAGAFFGISEELMKLFLRGILQTMIDKTAADGRTRRIDDYLSVSLKIHGKFDRIDDDFDENKHELALSLRPLGAFHPAFNLQPVNVNHKRQFRIYSVTAADGSRKNLQVVWKKDIRIKGADLLQNDGTAFVYCVMKTPHGSYMTDDPEIVSFSATEIVCRWPTEFMDDFYQRGTMEISVDKLPDVALLKSDRLIDRTKILRVFAD